MNAKNKFLESLVTDIDPSLISSMHWTSPTQNFRFFNKDGKGFIASVIPSDELYFEVTPGFQPMGSYEHDGILFLALYNSATLQGEIGSYPSYDGLQQYKPLPNFTGGVFRTTLFNFNTDYPVTIIGKDSYDGSIDLYLCDDNNPNKVINSGFNYSTYEQNSRIYSEGSFEGSIDHLPNSNKFIHILDRTDVIKGGILDPGNYFIYLRYVTSDYARTPFLFEIGPFSVMDNNTFSSANGLQEMQWTRNVKSVTDKKIRLAVSNIDKNYSYIEIGVTRYSSMQENAVATKDIYLVDKLYPIEFINDEIYLTGFESKLTLTFSEIIVPTSEYNICKDHFQIQDRYIGVNWKKSSTIYERESLRTFASKIEVGHFYKSGIIPTDYPTLSETDSGSVTELQGYQNGNNVRKYVGYFRKEIYPFGIKFRFDNGTESEVFPVKGNHASDILGDPDTCTGLYRFPDWSDTIESTKQNKILGVNFDCSVAQAYYDGMSAEDKLTNFGNTTGFYFVRADKIDNLICQGALMRGFNGLEITSDPGGPVFNDGAYGKYSFFGEYDTTAEPPGTSYDPSNAAIIPLLFGQMPFMMVRDLSGDVYTYGLADETGSYTDSCHSPGWITAPLTLPKKTDYISGTNNAYDNKHGLFSPDILFARDTEIPLDAYITPLFEFHHPTQGLASWLTEDPGAFRPQNYCLDLNYRLPAIISGANTYITLKSESFIPVASSFVEKGQRRGLLNFSSYFSGGDDRAFTIWDGSMKNRNIGTSRYIGLEDLSDDKDLRELHFDLNSPYASKINIVNLYKYENNDTFFSDTRTAFNPSTTLYSNISQHYALTADFSNEIELYCGDCFLQKTWFRTHRWYAMEDHGEDGVIGNPSIYGATWGDYCGIAYQHGMMIGIVTENKYNTELRNDVVGKDSGGEFVNYTFWPHARTNGATAKEWALTAAGSYIAEATQVNEGYRKILSDKVKQGFEVTEPEEVLEKSNRVYVSNKHIEGSFLDAYRIIEPESFKDYGIENGPITGVMKILDYVYLVHERGINQIYINERAVQENEFGVNVLGGAASFLSERFRNIAKFGSQHKSSLMMGELGGYGVDASKRILWRVNMFQSQGGGFFLGVTDIGTGKMFQHEIETTFDLYSTSMDRTSRIPDTPLSGIGIVSGYDPDNKEVLFSFLLHGESGYIGRTLVYGEIKEGYKGDYTFYESMYMNLGKQLLSSRHELQMPRSFGQEYIQTNEIWKYNSVSGYNTFKGIQQTAKLTIIVNGLSQEKEMNASDIRKIFNGLTIESKKDELFRIIYTTLYQTGLFEFDPDNTRFWMAPEYLEREWEIPIMVQTTTESSEGGDFEEDSAISGLWIKITIEYKGSNDPEIRSIITNFDISHV